MSLQQREQDRLARYAAYWKWYGPLTPECLFPLTNGTDTDFHPNRWNYLRPIVEAGVDFLAGKGFTIRVADPLVTVTLPFLDEVWRRNNRIALTYEVCITGSVTGDAFKLYTYVEPTEFDRALRPHAKGQIRIARLNSEQVFPEWDALDPTKMVKVRIETYFYPAVGGPSAEVAAGTMMRHTQVITAHQIIETLHGEIPTIRQNILGEIPLVHIKNIVIPGQPYGLSDLADLIGIQKDLDDKTSEISQTINYNGSPTIAMFGAKAKDLDKSSNTFWSGLPENAKIEVIRLGIEDIGAAVKYVEVEKKTLHEISGVPEAALGATMAISNTSGVALSMVYQPLLRKTRAKRAQYEPGFERGNYFILRIGQLTGMIKLPFDLCSCGGRIVEVETGKEITEWDPDTESYVTTPERKKKCYRIDPQTMNFLETKDVLVKALMDYGVGAREGEVKFDDVKKTAGDKKKSFWSAGVSHAVEEGMPEPKVDVTDFPKEPETVTVVTTYINPITGAVDKEHKERLTLIPTDCCSPQYLDPYQTDVDFNDVLPADEDKDALRYQLLLAAGVVDTEWVQGQIPKVAVDAHEIRERMKKKEMSAPEVPPDAPKGNNPLAPKTQADKPGGGDKATGGPGAAKDKK